MMFLLEIINRYKADLLLRNRSSGTITEYEKDLLMCVKYLSKNGIQQVNEVKERHIMAYLNHLIVEKEYKPSSRNRQMNTLRSFFKYCEKNGVVEVNPAKYIERLEETKVEVVSLSVDEVNELVQAMKHPIIQLVILTLFYTGARINECLSLELEDIDFKHKTIFIRNGKGNKSRTIPMHMELEKVLLKYINQWRADSGSNKVFLTKRSGGLSEVYVNRKLKETVKSLGWNKKVTCHVLRHTFASVLVQNNASIVAVQKLLGHQNIHTTSGYLHIQQQDAEEAIHKLTL